MTKKSLIIYFIITLMIISVIILDMNKTLENANPEYKPYDLISIEGHYSEFIKQHSNDFLDNEISYLFNFNEFIINDNALLEESYFAWNDDDTFEIQANIDDAGLYLIDFNYNSQTDTHLPVTISVSINDEIQYYELKNIVLDTLWKDIEQERMIDRYGNDLLNEQELYPEFTTTVLKDSERLYENGLYVYLNQGINNITFSKEVGNINVHSVNIHTLNALITYDEYIGQFNDIDFVDSTIIKTEAEDYYYKNSSTIIAGVNRDPLVTPFSLSKLKLNVLGVDTFNESGNYVTWKPNIMQAGLYYLTFKVKQDSEYQSMFRTLYVNNEIPFEEAKHIYFEYNPNWTNATIKSFNNENMAIYLEPGDEITLEVDGTLLNAPVKKLELIKNQISQLGLDLTKLTKNNTDAGIDWDIKSYFPTIETDLNNWITELKEIEYYLKNLYGYERDALIINNLKTSISKLEYILKDIDELPRLFNTLSRGSSSALQIISNTIEIILKQNMIIDSIYIHSSDSILEEPNPSLTRQITTEIKRFFISFSDPTYTTKLEENEIEIWVNRSRQFTDIIQQLADSEFTRSTGIKVKISIINNDSKLLLANSANNQPDAAMGVSAWIPNEYGMRGMLYDIKQIPGYSDTTSLFDPEQLVPYVYDDKLYGIPETENFYLLFYREDILEELNLEIPQTWEDVVKILPVLNRNGMNFYVPLSSSNAFKSFDATAPFIFQNGGSLYSEDGFSGGIDSEESIKAIEFMTDLYKEYGVPLQISSFFNQFRDGTVPIGIGDFGMYLQLTNAASDINGLWNVALVPGIEQEIYNQETDSYITEINRSMPGAQQGIIIFDKSEYKEEVWEFISWWMSTDTQIKYSERLINTLGNKYIWNSANQNAFANLRINSYHKNVILEQWNHLKEVPKIPGSYIVEREISNIWNNVVYNDANLRSQISDATIKINKELKRKMIEFNYLDKEGFVIKEFIIPKKEDILEWAGSDIS